VLYGILIDVLKTSAHTHTHTHTNSGSSSGSGSKPGKSRTDGNENNSSLYQEDRVVFGGGSASLFHTIKLFNAKATSKATEIDSR